MLHTPLPVSVSCVSNMFENDVNYVTYNALAKGAFGATFVVSCTSGKNKGMIGVIKVAHAIKGAPEMLLQEYNILTSLEHKHIIRVYDFEDAVNGRPARLFMEYGGTTLYDIVNITDQLAPYDAESITRQLLDAVAYLHERSIMHRDIKLENITIQDGHIKLIDFGLSSKVKNAQMNDRVGSPTYCAPEVLTHNSTYDGFKADAWSVGVVVFALWFRFFPFNQAHAKSCNIFARYAQIASRSHRSNVVRFCLFLYADRFFVAPPKYMDNILDKLLVIDTNYRSTVCHLHCASAIHKS